MANLEAIQEKIGYSFKNTALLERAITHSSYANEMMCEDNERLEFLGDSVLSLVISDKLFHKFGHIDEGRLSKMRAALVCEQSLDQIAKKIDLGNIIKLGRGEDITGGRKRSSVISDAFEALIAAIYLDSGIRSATKWINNLMKDEIAAVEYQKYFGDYKTQLQEILQSRDKKRVSYVVLAESGKDHMKEFIIAAMVEDVEVGRGVGSSKKEAEQQAAGIAVRKLLNEAL